MKKIVLIVRGNIDISPTISNYLHAFIGLKYEVHCICSSKKNNVHGNVKFYEVGSDVNTNIFTKLLNYYRFGRSAFRVLQNIQIDENTIIWVSRIDTALCLLRRLKKYKSILALHELHDNFPVWLWITKRLLKYYNSVVLNEINRANIARVWYRLSFTPSVIPNKPFNHPRSKNIQLSNQVISKLIGNIKVNKKIILYQGSLLRDRNLDPLVKASLKFNEKYTLILMGKDEDNRIEELKIINQNIVHISWVSPPDHLFITSHAHIGVAFYDFDCLNSIYCAPNKIWEYSGFGIPILGQNIPGLINTIGDSGAGLCVDIDDINKIVEAIHCIDANYGQYRSDAEKFYESNNFELLVQKALDRVK